jgi:hypothetical protein
MIDDSADPRVEQLLEQILESGESRKRHVASAPNC